MSETITREVLIPADLAEFEAIVHQHIPAHVWNGKRAYPIENDYLIDFVEDSSAIFVRKQNTDKYGHPFPVKLRFIKVMFLGGQSHASHWQIETTTLRTGQTRLAFCQWEEVQAMIDDYLADITEVPVITKPIPFDSCPGVALS